MKFRGLLSCSKEPTIRCLYYEPDHFHPMYLRFVLMLCCYLCLGPTIRCLYYEPDHFHPMYLRFVLMLCCYLCLGLPSGLFPSGFPIKILYTSLLPIHATRHTLLICRDLTTHIIFGADTIWIGCSYVKS